MVISVRVAGAVGTAALRGPAGICGTAAGAGAGKTAGSGVGCANAGAAGPESAVRRNHGTALALAGLWVFIMGVRSRRVHDAHHLLKWQIVLRTRSIKRAPTIDHERHVDQRHKSYLNVFVSTSSNIGLRCSARNRNHVLALLFRETSSTWKVQLGHCLLMHPDATYYSFKSL
jgi:hypothetical protein